MMHPGDAVHAAARFAQVRTVARRSGIPRVFAWDVVAAAAAPDEGRCGVSRDRGRAVAALGDALRESQPGACGTVAEVELSMMGVGYVLVGLVARAEVDQTSGAVVWDVRA